jgi:hypothetical protein
VPLDDLSDRASGGASLAGKRVHDLQLDFRAGRRRDSRGEPSRPATSVRLVGRYGGVTAAVTDTEYVNDLRSPAGEPGNEVGGGNAGEDAAVELDGRFGGDHVDLVAAADDRRVDGVVQQWVEYTPAVAQQIEDAVAELDKPPNSPSSSEKPPNSPSA